MTDPLLPQGTSIDWTAIDPVQIPATIGHGLQLAQQRLARLRALGDAAGASDPAALTWETTVGALEDATFELEHALTLVGHLDSVATTPALHSAYSEARERCSPLFSSIVLDAQLQQAIERYALTDEARHLDSERARLLANTRIAFRRNGAGLAAEAKQRVEAIDLQLTQLALKYSQHVLDATGAFQIDLPDADAVRGLPESALAMARDAATAAGSSGYRLTLHAPSYIPSMTFLEDRALRERLWRAYNTRAAEANAPIIQEMIELRAEKAALLGYATFADYVLEQRMAGSGRAALDFLRSLEPDTRAAATREQARLEQLAVELGEPSPLQAWDVARLSELERKRLHDLDEESLRPYFPADRVLQGAFELARRLFGVELSPITATAWHDDVRTYAARGANGDDLGHLQVDLAPRDTKRGGAWMNGLVTGVTDPKTGSSTPHLVVLCANLSPPAEGKPALLSHDDVLTVLHELGHVLHHLCSRVSVRSLAGTNVAWDFVELPSQLMENWGWTSQGLDLLSGHFETGEALPTALRERLFAARSHRAGSAQLRQLGLASADLALHTSGRDELPRDAMARARDVMQAHTTTPIPPDYAMIASFHHLFGDPVGYAAGYYSYKWAEVLEADVFSLFEREGVLNPDTATRYLRSILSRGDSAAPGDLFRELMGRDPDPSALMARLAGS